MMKANRFAKFLMSLPAISTRYSEIGEYVYKIEKSAENIDPMDYPKTLLGKNIRANVNDIVKLTDTLEKMYGSGENLIPAIPYLLAPEEPFTIIVSFS